ncbi:MAG: hypothetical protein CVU51_00600 [Deltaproteobacteria bacterium HGW-Deltaproteobacteria-1]|jgi:hypothetical protein|nr:MAG: hypothetical protein CVU51_00600 [Deltaproteobacteria bacterium HGW-Deltaproteobacteria-1]
MPITTVQLFSNNSGQNKLVFGMPDFEVITPGENNTLAGFKPDSVFCILSKTYSTYGTRRFKILILRALNEYEKGRVIDFIKPGAEILIQEKGRKHVDCVLTWLRKHKKNNTELSSLTPAYYRSSGNRFRANMEPRIHNNKNSIILERIAV